MEFLTEENDFKISSGIQAIYFYASWMPFHKKMLVMIGKIQEKYKEISFQAVDTDYFKSLSKRFKIDSIPTVIILKEGKECKRIVGITLTSAFKTAFNDICSI